MIILIIIVVLLIGLSPLFYKLTQLYEPGYRHAGRIAEESVANKMQMILRDGEYMLRNISLEIEGRRAEADIIIITKCGVFIFEVKDYVGELYGTESDYNWVKIKRTEAGNVYRDEVRNPIQQVKREIHLFAEYLRYYGVNVWVIGKVVFYRGRCPFSSDHIIDSVEETDTLVHTFNRNHLQQMDVDKIYNLLKPESENIA